MSINRYTFTNGGTSFSFRHNQMSKYPLTFRGESTLVIHAEMVLAAMDDGRKDVFLTDPAGKPLSRTELKEILSR